MGLFSSKKKIYVSSTVYNLAGDINNRVQYLPTSINTKIIGGSSLSIGETIQKTLINGPGMRFRRYARWARESGYAAQLGMKTGLLNLGNSINLDTLVQTLPHAADETPVVQTAEIGVADYGFWADRWMSENHPEIIDRNYDVDFNEVQNLITITFADGTVFSFQPTDFDPNAMYLYVSYLLTKQKQYGLVTTGQKTDVASEGSLPSTTGYTKTAEIPTAKSSVLTDTTVTEVTYSDNRPAEKTTSTQSHTDSFTDVETRYEKESTVGPGSLSMSILGVKIYQTNFKEGRTKETTTTTTKTETISGNVTKTTKTTVTKQSIEYKYAYRRDDQDVVISSWSNLKVLIYKKGDGNPTYDAFFNAPDNLGSFVPFIPLRQWARMMDEEYLPDLYDWSKKAIDKAMDTDIEYVTDQLKKNENLRDIDFAYVSFGVSLNTKENSCKKYIYKFFQLLNEYGQSGEQEYAKWKAEWEAANQTQLAWLAWKAAQSDPSNDRYGKPEPGRDTYPQMPNRTLQVYSEVANYNMSLTWSALNERVVAGLGKSGAKVGELWLEMISMETFNELMVSGAIDDTREQQSDTVAIYWQDKADSYRVMLVTGLRHTNIIYKGKGVDIHAGEALADPEESGFIVPLHEGVYREISLKDATQMATGCSYMVLNSYQVVKKKWYSSSWFKIVLIIVIIVVTIVTAGAGAGFGAGVFGTAASVGAAVGMAGVAAIIVGAAINAIAGMIIAQIIMMAANKLIGGTAGAVIGAIAAAMVLSVGTSVATGGTAAQGLTNLATAPQLLKMTVAAGQGIAGAMESEFADLQKQMKELQDTYSKELSDIMEKWGANLGFTQGTIDVTQLTDSAKGVFEPSDTFLSRTLLLGSDISDITNNLISSFVDITISTELPT